MPGRGNRNLTRRQWVAGAAAGVAGTAVGYAVPMFAKSLGGSWGDLTGRFVYRGDRPERKKLKVDKDVDFCGKFDIRDESLMIGPDGGLMNVYVYVRSRRVAICPELEQTAEKSVLLDNRGCIFVPHCMAVWYPKQSYHIVNSDPVAQNVAFRPFGDVEANIVLTPPPDKAAEATWQFRRAQRMPVPIKCNYHPWESAYVLPRDNPYVAISDIDGRFRIPMLPVGELEFQVWQERVQYVATAQWPRGRFKMEIKPGVNDLGTIELPASMFEV